MANINISQLPNLSPLTAAAVLPVDSGGSTYHVTAANLATYINTNAGNIIPALNNTYFLGNSTNRWANLWLGPGTLYITDSNIASNVTAALTVTDGVLLINGVNQQQVGQLKFVDNTIESTTGNIPIQIGLTTSSANLVLNRNTVLAAGKTLGLVDTANTANVATLSVTNGVLNIGNVVQLQAPGIANGNANIAISNTGNVTITTLPGSTPLQWIFDDTGNLRCASVTEQDNLIGENNGDFFITGSQSVKLNAGLSGNVSLTVNESNITVTGDIFTTGNTIIENDTNATDAASGSLQTLGGAAIAQDLYVGSNIYSNGVTVGGSVLVQDGSQNNIIELQTDGNIVFNGGSTLNLNGGFYVSSVSPNSGDANIVNYVGGAFVYGPALKDYAGNIGANNVTLTGILKAPQTTKASTATGTTGQICWDANYIYVCTATNTWKRSPLTGGY